MKIKNEVETKVRQMISEGHNARQIGLALELNPESVRNWAKKNGVELSRYRSPVYVEKEKKFVELMKSGKTLTEASREVDVDAATGIKWAKNNNIDGLIRTKAEANREEKTFTLQDAQNKLPVGHGTVEWRNPKTRMFLIRREDGTYYERSIGMLPYGDPNNHVVNATRK